jgi:hypothetical protein
MYVLQKVKHTHCLAAMQDEGHLHIPLPAGMQAYYKPRIVGRERERYRHRKRDGDRDRGRDRETETETERRIQR